MTKPCSHDMSHPGCRVCHLAATDARYQRLWGLSPATPAPAPHIVRPHPALAAALACVHKGQPTGRLVGCGSCAGKAAGKVLEVKTCDVFGACTDTASVESGLAQCQGCTRLQSPPEIPPVTRQVKWAYGVTTIPERRADLLPRTLASLKAAGFDSPRLFVDGDRDLTSWEQEFGLGVTVRCPRIRVAANWLLAFQELMWRDPTADRYALFQDDFVMSRNVRPYLDTRRFPEKGYWNLYTFPSNQQLCPKDKVGWFVSNQLGRGAVALVFSREGATTLLSQRNHIVERPFHASRGWRLIDGGISDAMRPLGWSEYVHSPSLTQHTGTISSFSKVKTATGEEADYPKYTWADSTFATSFRGEDFDALDLLK